MKELIRRLTQGPSPTEILARELLTAERQRIEATAQREYYSAMEEMLARRITRLITELHNRTTP